ncbi:hypothetical protein Ami103574_06510 [Aminipila butyrica]|uniref:DUF4430 domain-containing protein n=1 Tax=Aminipila butyrica TaxID=433296 RepID=A0A858BY49_9FIRM|nr:hypothetical protein [Aminipila butyrica]QIB68996.1 hypothetical protein Ami103574_06510 [Aminipila butyrica]
MKKMLNSKIMAFALSAALVMGMSATAFASDSDPNMTDYTGQLTYVVDAADVTAGGAAVELMAGPANSYWAYTGFSTEAAAAAVEWDVVSGSTAGIDIDSTMALEVDTNEYVSYAYVTIDSNVTSGVASIVATNPANNAFVNFTVLVNPTTLVSAEAEDVNFEVYAPAATTPTASGTIDVAANGYYSNRNFVTALDGTPAMLSNSIIQNYSIQYNAVDSMTLGTNKYGQYTVDNGDGTYTYYGWQYRVYRGGNVVGISEVLGADDFALQSGDTVVWKFGSYDDAGLFN